MPSNGDFIAGMGVMTADSYRQNININTQMRSDSFYKLSWRIRLRLKQEET